MIGREHRKNPNLSTLERLYVGLFGYPALGLHIRAKAVLPFVRRCQNPVKILDAGCGNGSFTFALARIFKNATVKGIDNQKKMIENNNAIAQVLSIQNCMFECKDITKLEETDEYDLLLSTDNLEHVEDDTNLLRVFCRAIRNSGRLILHVPHATRNIFGWKRRNFMGIEGHVRPGYKKDQLKNMLQSAGFEVEVSEYNYNSLETLFNDISYLITEGREKRKELYAFVFPLLLLLTRMLSWWPIGRGSGLIMLARKK